MITASSKRSLALLILCTIWYVVSTILCCFFPPISCLGCKYWTNVWFASPGHGQVGTMDWGNQGCSSHSQGIAFKIILTALYVCFSIFLLYFQDWSVSRVVWPPTWICDNNEVKEKLRLHHSVDISWLYSAGNGIQWDHSTNCGYCALYLPHGAACVSSEVLPVCWAHRNWQICLYHGLYCSSLTRYS